MKHAISIVVLFLLTSFTTAQDSKQLLRVGVVGLSHDHVHAVLGRHRNGELEIVGIAETNRELAKRLSGRYGFPMDLVHDSIEVMLDKAKPTVVSDYGTTFGHLETVKAAAPRGIHVMVEKPLAVNMKHANEMQRLVQQHTIHLLTNYETTWYASHHRAKHLLADESFGPIRRIVVHDGHRGPIEIGCSKEFVEWLIDPKLNGGGALMDFGCYGANLATWLFEGQRPESVTAITQQIKPDIYPDVEDEATILIKYPKSQAIIQASWNWNYNRKDIEIYCKSGHVHCLSGTDMVVKQSSSKSANKQIAKPLPQDLSDPYRYFHAVVKGEVEINPTDLSALENNMLVMEILEAAKLSAEEGRTVQFGK